MAALVLLLAGALIALSMLLGARLATSPAGAVPTGSSVDAGFLQDMQSHHAQAVAMSLTVRESTEDEQVRTLALDVLLTQQQQIGQMYGWLSVWGLPQSSSRAPMAWMGGDGMAVMPGMASRASLEDLGQAQGDDAARTYLELMIPHHQGAVEMARPAATSAKTPQVRQLAQKILDSQRLEITTLQQMLDERGGAKPPP